MEFLQTTKAAVALYKMMKLDKKQRKIDKILKFKVKKLQ